MVFQRHRTFSGSLLAFFFLACALYFISSAPVVSRSVTLNPVAFQILVAVLYASAGGLISLVHFAFVFPEPKEIVRKHAWFPALLYGYFVVTVTLYLGGIIAFGTTLPFFCLWILIMVGAFLHSLFREKDPFLKKQIRLSLMAPILADLFFILFYILPGTLQITQTRFEYFALFSLIIPFALPEALDNLSLYQEKLAIERQEYAERERIRAELHDISLKALANVSLIAKRGHLDAEIAMVRERLASIEALVTEADQQLRGILQITDARHNSWANLCGYLRAWGYKVVEPLEIAFALDHAPDLLDLPPPSLQLRVCLVLVYMEAVMNAIKHSRAQKIQASLSCSEEGVMCVIQDDGNGFCQDATSEGHFGLPSMHKRVTDCGGILTVDSQAGRGTYIQFQLPLT
jgi:signal transduction histidine kinase